MIALYNFVPKFCPYCGTKTRWANDRELWDYNMRIVKTCSCGLHHQRASTDAILHASHESEGDLWDKAKHDKEEPANFKKPKD